MVTLDFYKNPYFVRIKIIWVFVYSILVGIILENIFKVIDVNSFPEIVIGFTTMFYIFFHEKYFLDPISELSYKLLKKIF